MKIPFEKIVFVVFGTSGSGKSTLAQYLAWNSVEESEIFEADKFFVNPKDGKYEFNPADLGAAHAWCRTGFRDALSREVPLVIVSNTNTRWENERKFYVDTAKKFGYVVFSVCAENVNETTDRHSVPEETLIRQEKNILNSIKLRK